MPMPSRIVERMLQAIRDAAITGSTISAAISRIPTMRIETAIVTAASATVERVQRGDREPCDTCALLVDDDRDERPVEQRDHGERAGAERGDHGEVAAGHGEDRAEEELEEVHVERARGRHEHDAARDPRVEDQRERLVARGSAPGADPLDRQAAGDRDDERRQHERQVRAGTRARRRRTRRGRSRRRPG